MTQLTLDAYTFVTREIGTRMERVRSTDEVVMGLQRGSLKNSKGVTHSHRPKSHLAFQPRTLRQLDRFKLMCRALGGPPGPVPRQQ
jgi:hypothetical protein